MTDTRKDVLILGGPNGAGKTTFAREFLVAEAGCPAFINADLIAAGLSPFAPERASMRAGRLMVQMIADHVRRGESFAIESTLADRTFIRSIHEWQAEGYHVSLWFLALPSAEMAIDRVRLRTSQGGHSVPDEVVRRRFEAGRNNFEQILRGLVDSWALYDSSQTNPLLLDWGERR